MFRSLLIGFLILSALTSKGAGAQIVNANLNISADMLLEFFNSVSAQTAKNAEISPAKAERGLLSYALSDNKAVIPFRAMSPRNNAFTWYDPIDKSIFRAVSWEIYPGQILYYRSGVFSHVSGLSPPYAGDAIL
ncbi:MAG TPA: hypothetical protein VHT96_00710 [Clostridia bacterium]|nr:hypothetical protein [Clostridia bacterium]